MDLREAVKTALAHAESVFEGEDVRLEEIWFDETTKEWCVTVGLRRPEPKTGPLSATSMRPPVLRTHYKTVRVDDVSGAIKSLRNHEKMPVSPL